MYYGAALARDGFAIMRGFLRPLEAKLLRELVGAIYQEMATTDHFPDEQMADHFRRWHGVALAHMDEFLAARQSPMLPSYRRLLSLIAWRTRRRVGIGWQLYLERCYFRRHYGAGKSVPWHIDADAAALDRGNCINVWLPIERVGDRLPSLELVRGSHHAMRFVPQLRGDDRSRDISFVRAFGPSSAPILDPGDAIVFDQFLLHRTQCVEHDDFERSACEFRFERIIEAARKRR